MVINNIKLIREKKIRIKTKRKRNLFYMDLKMIRWKLMMVLETRIYTDFSVLI